MMQKPLSNVMCTAKPQLNMKVRERFCPKHNVQGWKSHNSSFNTVLLISQVQEAVAINKNVEANEEDINYIFQSYIKAKRK